MLSKICSAAVRGIEGFLVGVELDLSNGLPTFTTVGLPDSSVREARERVVAAIRNSGFQFPHQRVTVNLAPAQLRKAGTQLDLPIGLGMLMASGQIEVAPWAQDYCFLGELALDGSIRPVSGVLPMASAAREKGVSGLILPEANAREAGVAGISACGISSLRQAADILRSARPPEAFVTELPGEACPRPGRDEDLADIKGQVLARRALEIAAAGGHNLLMVGPPGTGKSMLARRLPGLLPPLEEAEALEVTKIFSVCGLLPADTALIRARPLRAPHHTASLAALTGGGAHCRPGELSLAHRGVLFLDELPEFPRALLETLRQPLEEQRVTVSRLKETVEYPADFMLVAAMNPCPCGYLGHAARRCRCAPYSIGRYRAKVSGPLLDRIDLQVELASLPFAQWADESALREGSAEVARRVQTARSAAAGRNRGPLNARLTSRQIQEHCRLDKQSWSALKLASRKQGFSARVLDRLLRVARTIADLAGKEAIGEEHIMEAIHYRILERPLDISG